MEFDTIVFSGGGSNGYIFLGFLKYLFEHNMMKSVNKFYGTSIGSVFATLLAMNFTYDEILTNIFNFNYESCNNINVVNLFNKTLGLDDMSGIKEYLLNVFNTKSYSDKTTFKDLNNDTSNLLVINAVSLYNNNIKYFSHVDTPDVPIIYALLSSMSIPYLFSPVNLLEDMYVDGGIIENLITNHHLLKSCEKVLYLNITISVNWTTAPITNLYIYTRQLIMTIFINTKHKVDLDDSKSLYIDIPVYSMNSIDMSIDDSEKNRLIKYGYSIINSKMSMMSKTS